VALGLRVEPVVFAQGSPERSRDGLAAQFAGPTWRLKGSAIVIESKDEVRKRLGASTDDADAVILAWHKRDDALRQTRRRLEPGRHIGPGGSTGM
jgi:hypothetical protein